jgi:predicted phage-related endonuclease
MSTTTKVTTTVTTTEEIADLDVTAEELIKEFNDAKAAIKALKAVQDEAENKLRELLGYASVGRIGGVERVRILVRSSSHVDRDALKAGWPEAFDATLKVTPYTVLQAK